MYISLQSGDVAIPPIIPALAISLAPPPDRKDFKVKLYAGATVLLLISSGSPRMAGSGNRRLVQLDAERLGLLDISPPHAQSALSLQILDARIGSVLGVTSRANDPVRIDNALVLTAKVADVPSSSLIWVESGRLLSLKLGDKLEKPSRLAAYTSSPIAQVRDVGLSHLGMFVAHHEDGTAAAISCAEGRLELRWQFADASSDSLFAAFVDRLGDAHIGHLSFSSSLQLGSFQIYSAAATEASPAGMLAGHTFPFDQDRFGSMITFAFEATPPNAYNVATRSYISTTSGAAQAWEGSHVIWHQEQSLSNIDSPALYWDVAETVQHDSSSSLLADSSFASRLRRHLHAVSRLLDRSTLLTSIGLVPTSRQLAFVASSAYRTIFALDLAQQGRVVWRACLDAEAGRWDSSQRLRMSELDGGRPTVSLALVDDAESRSTTLVQLDALTGMNLRLDETPSSSSSQDVLHETSASDKIKIEVSGTSIAGLPLRPLGLEKPIWALHLAEQEQVVAVAVSNHGKASRHSSAPPADMFLGLAGVVASTGRILGDRSTLLKYLNPNMIAVVTVSPATTSSSVLLIDTKSGALLQRIGPISDVDEESHLSLALQDNWIVLTYRVAGEAARVSKVLSVELYHAPADLHEAEAAPIQALSRTFVSTQNLEIKSFTRTKLGITTYSAICRGKSSLYLGVSSILGGRSTSPRSKIKRSF
uniref:ER membrane protein complex subunit 1 n=1 Tax=Leucosporidium scottii TaxID=5278 RepID=A0A0H5FUL7_9BASI|nr:hypothetical protein [Leucosporidium scottii]